MELRRPENCPSCNATQVRRIVYGLVMGETLDAAIRKEVVLGGCIVGENMPTWECAVCGHRWYDATDPAWQQRERAVKRLAGYPENAPPLGDDSVDLGS